MCLRIVLFLQSKIEKTFRIAELSGINYKLYIVDVLGGQPIKLIQVAFTSELLENQPKDLVFFKIIPSHFCRASEASKINHFKN